ncbi:class II fumarate hydratase [Fructilactobacillus florum]|uniref:class II fumarate hydratase n=1 Tax=Fructilactobacillus florum TaxID=640331 RepID=UPI00028DC3EC|nr:class II fumarate hydratase [Fructilactobacillus florum]EKK20394.1 Fumarate hydratase class II [Fructilactobacillus florum 2F]
MSKYREETDTLGKVRIPQTAWWGPQTERSRQNFVAGPTMPLAVIRALLTIKQCAAIVNARQKKLPLAKKAAIVVAVSQLLELSDADLRQHFPLRVYQTGSGTQTNMNVNEVICYLANHQSHPVALQPNDDVNQSQSSNDTFPTAMNIAALQALPSLLERLTELIKTFQRLENKYRQTVKIGRTHLQDATPMTFGQEVSGWRTIVEQDLEALRQTMPALQQIPIGGTAVGTGLNTPPAFTAEIVLELQKQTGLPLQTMNQFGGLTSHTALVTLHGAVSALASDLMKIANDIRFLASGPRAGYGELRIPANEPGSSIMPGKVNPTQAEAMTMAATRVMGNQTTMTVANSQGNFELNVYKPVLIATFLESVNLISELLPNFTTKLVAGITVNQERMTQLVDRSLMTVTALAPHIGYHQAARLAQQALDEDQDLRTVVLASGLVSSAEFDRWVDPMKMTNSQS